MAKAGFWLRGARGKLAGASAQKGQNGTILREIVKPRNPKTDKQIYQRAIMATVMKAYSAGKEIFDHAFQGVEKGQKSQQYFIARNATILRSLIAQDINAIAAGTLQPTAAVNACVAPKALYAVPGAFMVSEGTYEQNFFVFSEGGNLDVATKIPQNEETHTYNETVQSYAQRAGLIPGDIYTFVVIAATNNVAFNGVDMAGQLSDNKGTKQYTSVFGYCRMQVKADVLTNTAEVSEDSESSERPDLTLLFDVTAVNNANAFQRAAEDDLIILGDGLVDEGSAAIIRSRIDEDLRSTSYMKVINKVGSDVAYGITSPYVLPTWKKGTDSLGTSELILESDN